MEPTPVSVTDAVYDYEKTGIEDKNIRLEKMNSGD